MRTKVKISKSYLNGRYRWRKTATNSVNPAELFARTPFPPEALARLNSVRVVIFGCGSIGGKLALDFTKAGVRRQCLVDPDRLELHNCARHVLGLDAVGRYKADALADRILLFNPGAEIEVVACDLFSPGDDHHRNRITAQELVQDASLVVAATDRKSIQLQINALTWKMRVPTLFGGCFEAARGGEVFITLPGEGTPCLSCLRGGLVSPNEHTVFDYSAASTPEDFHGEPGLNAAVDMVTNVMIQLGLGILLRPTSSTLAQLISPQTTYWLVGSATSADFYRFKRPFQIFWQPLKGPRPGCDVCQVEFANADIPEVPGVIPDEYQRFLHI